MLLNEKMIKKKNGLFEKFDGNKIIKAISKSADRISIVLTEKEKEDVVKIVLRHIESLNDITVRQIHNYVEMALDKINPAVAKSYKDYRNYKLEYGLYLMNDIENQVKKTLYEVDRENSNSNTRYISTKRTEIAQTFAKEMYQKMYLSTDVIGAIKDGYIYIHDLKDMLLPQFNCCLTDVASILKNGFELEGIYYTEPKDIRTAVGQVGDIIMIVTAQHFGGNTTPEIDKVLAPYYKMSIDKLENKYKELGIKDYKEISRKEAYNELKQSLQGLEIKLNTVVSARGSYPFTTFSFGNCENEYEEDIAKAILQVRMEGHGLSGKKKTLIFPKLVFLHSVEKHGKDGKYRDLFLKAIECSSKCMYPDYIGWNHTREGKFVSPMGCRAFLSNYRDEETNELVFNGRANIGAISLNLPMIFMKAKEEKKDFFDVLEIYLQMIRKLHLNRYEYLSKAKASSNPLLFTQGGLYGGTLNPEEEIRPLLKYWTASFGITALNELQILYNNKRLSEDNEFAKKVMQYINDRVGYYKEVDDKLYAIYNTPAESLCGTQVKQFRNKYGVISGVSDKDYFTNSNHLWVGEQVNPFEKQNKEIELFNMSTGGHIGYVRISNPSNIEGLTSIVERGLKLGFYQGVNFNNCYCNDCGHTGSEWGEICPHCGSANIDEQNRTCGYLGFSRKSGDRTFNDAKMAEIKDRISM